MKAYTRGGLVAFLAGTAVLATAVPALATTPQVAAPQEDEVAVVDEPDTSGLHNKWTFSPAGVPVLGLIDSVADAPGKILPGA